jgi:hypothetical protein
MLPEPLQEELRVRVKVILSEKAIDELERRADTHC